MSSLRVATSAVGTMPFTSSLPTVSLSPPPSPSASMSTLRAENISP